MTSKILKYADDILSGKINACEFVQLSIKRHFADLEKDWEYYFDEEAGLRPIKFFNMLRLYEGDSAGKKFKPEPWQAWILYVLFGWKRKDTNKRRFKYAYIEVPRKNGKTTFMGGIALYHLMKDNENAPAIYFVATKYAQAMEAMKDAIGLASFTPEISKRLTLFAKSIKYPLNLGEMVALGGDSTKQDGLNPSLAVIDEYHAHPDNGMFDKIKTAFGMRSQPTMLMITTAGSNRNYPCYQYRKRCIDVLQSATSPDDEKVATQENLFSIIYTLDEGDDWKVKKNWIKANPSWGIMNQIEYADEAKEAIEFAHAETAFKNLRLNIWTDAHATWVKQDDWIKCAGKEKSAISLKGVKCYAGADFASTMDLNSLELIFNLSDGTKHVKSFFWIPEKKVREKEDHVDYWVWKKEGKINVVGGDAIDHSLLAKEIVKVLSQYNVVGMTYDKYGIGESVIQAMISEGYPVSKLHPIKQWTTFLQGPIRKMEEDIMLQRMNHEGHPVLAWNISNVILYMDAFGGVKFNKSKAVERIDGAVALAMAYAEEIAQEKDGPIKCKPIFL